MSLKYIVAGDFGQPIELTFVDVDTSEEADISGYGTVQMIFTDPSGTVVTKTAAFKTDGTDGIISYTPEEDLLTAGIWDVRGQAINGSTAKLRTTKHKFEVID